ncbi:hypothetical protein AB9X29_001004 [Vibrio vulnificus]
MVANPCEGGLVLLFCHRQSKHKDIATMLVKKKTITTCLMMTSLLFAPMVMANPDQALINQYNLAVEGETALVDHVYGQLNALIEREGAKPLSLVYLGSTQTLQGRDAFLPWNKMKLTEQGLATISKGLGMLDTLPPSQNEQQRIQGLPEGYLARAMAAATYTSLPDMFNHFERGYELYLELLAEPDFQAQPFAATSWVYRYAIQAALRAQDVPQAKTWLDMMVNQDRDNLDTRSASAQIDAQG